MSHVPSDLKYTDSHEWVSNNGDGTVTIGITEYAQVQLGDLVFVELPDLGRNLEVGEPAGTLESVKAVSEFYAPIAGKIIAVNTELESSPELVNEDTYGDGWLIKLTDVNFDQLNSLLSAGQYSQLLAGAE